MRPELGCYPRSAPPGFLGDPALAEHPDYATDADRAAHREALGEIIAARFAELDGAEAVELLSTVPVANARVNSLAEVWEHPQLAARGGRHEVATPAGPVPSPAPPGPTTGEPRMDPVPALGQHTRAILAELGMSAEEIEQLVATGRRDRGAGDGAEVVSPVRLPRTGVRGGAPVSGRGGAGERIRRVGRARPPRKEGVRPLG